MDTHFLTLSRDAFNYYLSLIFFFLNYLEEFYKRKTKENIAILKGTTFFKDWTETMISQLYYYFEEINIYLNDVMIILDVK